MPVLMQPKFKIQFFDRSMVKRNWRRINNDPLARASAIVMVKARSSIKRRGGGKKRVKMWNRKPSPPGTPPRSWGRGASPPFKMIRFAKAGVLGSAYAVGMVGFGGATVKAAPELMEHGGTAKRRVVERKGSAFVHQSSRKKHGKYAKRKTTGGKRVTKMVRYPERPFMFPALKKTKDKLPQLWRDSINPRTVG